MMIIVKNIEMALLVHDCDIPNLLPVEEVTLLFDEFFNNT